jgi:hypothetical protein
MNRNRKRQNLGERLERHGLERDTCKKREGGTEIKARETHTQTGHRG